MKARNIPAHDATAVVNELEMVLTGGRMAASTKAIVTGAYSRALVDGYREHALRVATKLIMASAEFHSTGLNLQTPALRPLPGGQQSAGRPYKAVIVLVGTEGLLPFLLFSSLLFCSLLSFFFFFFTLLTRPHSTRNQTIVLWGRGGFFQLFRPTF